MHDLALEELHYVIENRSKLQDYLTKSTYFQFFLREMMQDTIDNMTRGEATG